MGGPTIYHYLICGSIDYNIYDFPHKYVAHEIFKDKISTTKPKKEDVAIGMVLTNLTKVPKTTQLVFKDKSPHKTKIVVNWDKDEKFQKSFESIIQ
jgi:hypothetical protein